MPKQDTPIVEVNKLCKYYPLYSSKRDRLIEALDPFRRKRHTTFSALQDVSFSIMRGESVGIMGINGAGKSTLLKVLTGVLTPSSGTAKVHGRVAALLELGAGFHPERTGIENVYFQGAFLGFSKQEVDAYLPDVIAFADIGEFISQPVKLYSSGMFVRLAFALAIQAQPDILIVDEALAVGDIRFQRKCFQRIEDLKRLGTTFLFVSHATEQIVTHCTRALLLYQGRILMDDAPKNVTNRYLDMLLGNIVPFDKEDELECSFKNKQNKDKSDIVDKIFSKELAIFYDRTSVEDRFSSSPFYNCYEYRWGDRRAAIIDVLMVSAGNIRKIYPGDEIKLHLKVYFKEGINFPIFGFSVKTKDGITVYGTNSEQQNVVPYKKIVSGQIVYVTYIVKCNIPPGEYFISCGVAVRQGNDIPLDRRFDSLLLTVQGPAPFWGLADMEVRIAPTEHI